MPNTFHDNSAVVALILILIAFLFCWIAFKEFIIIGLVIGGLWYLGRRSLKRLDSDFRQDAAKRYYNKRRDDH